MQKVVFAWTAISSAVAFGCCFVRFIRMKWIRLQLVRPVLHVLVIVFCFRAMYLLRQYTDLIPFVQLRIPTINFRETMLFAVWSWVLFVMLWVVYNQYALFRPGKISYSAFLQTAVLWIMLSGFVAWMWFGFVFVNGISRFVLLIWSIGSILLISLVDLIREWRTISRLRISPYRLLVLGEDEEKRAELIEELSWWSWYEMLEGTVDDAVNYSVDCRDACLVVWACRTDRLQQWSDQCRIAGKDLYHLPAGHFLEDMVTRPTRLWPLMVISYTASPLSGRWRVVKRVGDVCGAFLGLVVLSPILLLIALLIRLDSPWPILYTQQRVGKNKQPFLFIKFRTMYTHLSLWDGYGGVEAMKLYEQLIASEKNTRRGILPKIAHDPRVTRIWRFLRKTSLDELPSLWSVLMWDMSLVWPRPHLPREVAQYAWWQERLFAIKPGITGYAQLYGRDKVPFDEEAKLDLRYIQHWSVWLDLFIIVATVKVVLGWR